MRPTGSKSSRPGKHSDRGNSGRSEPGYRDRTVRQTPQLLATRLWKRGSVDYRRVPELVGVDLEVYRSAAREEVRVTVS